MVILIAIACILFWGAFQKNAESYFKFSFFLLFIITAFRHPALSGTDGLVYYSFYRNTPTIDNIIGFDSIYRIGFVWLVSISKTIYDSYLFFQVFYTAITFFLLSKVIKSLELRGQEKCILLFCYLCGFGLIWDFWVLFRQNISNLLFAYFIIYYIKTHKNNTFIKNCVILVVSIIIPNLFHSSAIFNVVTVVLFLLLPKTDKPETRLKWVVAVAMLIFAVGITFWGWFASLAVQMDDHYSGYLEDGGVSSNIINFVFKIVLFGLYCLNFNKVNYPYKRDMLNVQTVYLLIGSIDVGVVSRVAAYYMFGDLVSRSYIPSFNKPWRGIKLLFFLAMVIIFVRAVFFQSLIYDGNYIFFWQSVDLFPEEYSEYWLPWKNINLI